MNAGQSHMTSVVIDITADTAFAYLSNPSNLQHWSFGTWETRELKDDLIEGVSLFDGSKVLVSIDADSQRYSIDFLLGSDSETLVPRISARTVPGTHVGLAQDQCVLSLIAWRTEEMNDMRWRRLVASHELEVMLIKARLESLGFLH